MPVSNTDQSIKICSTWPDSTSKINLVIVNKLFILIEIHWILDFGTSRLQALSLLLSVPGHFSISLTRTVASWSLTENLTVSWNSRNGLVITVHFNGRKDSWVTIHPKQIDLIRSLLCYYRVASTIWNMFVHRQRDIQVETGSSVIINFSLQTQLIRIEDEMAVFGYLPNRITWVCATAW